MSAGSFGINEVNYALKRIYPKYPPENIASTKHPFMAKVRKEDGWIGEENFKQGLEYGNPQGGGGDFAKAQAVGGNTVGDSFDVVRRWKYWFATIQGKAIVATSGNEGAFFRAVKRETDNGFRAFGDRLATELLCGDGNGTLGIRASISTETITLTKKWHARRFKLGMAIEASSDGTSSGLRSYTTAPKVTAVDIPNGKFTIDDHTLITSFTDNDYLGAAGDIGVGLHGVASWIPLTAPSATAFFGVTRTKDIVRLSGHRLASTASSNSIKENAQDLAATMSTTGASPDAGILSPLNWNRLQKDLDADIETERVMGADGMDAGFGLSYITQSTPTGPIRWYSDPDQEDDVGHMLTMETWVVRHAWGFPHLNDDDGNAALRVYNQDAIEVRMRSAGNLFCLAPGHNGVFPINAPA